MAGHGGGRWRISGGGGGGAPHAMGGGGAALWRRRNASWAVAAVGCALAALPHFGGGPHFGGAHLGGGAPRFGGRPAISRFAARPVSAANVRLRRAAAGLPAADEFERESKCRHKPECTRLQPNRNVTERTSAVRNVLNSPRSPVRCTIGRAAKSKYARSDRCSAATAGWHEGRRGGGWWRHRNGGYGWVGPLFWPFAYYDIYDYAHVGLWLRCPVLGLRLQRHLCRHVLALRL